MYTEHFGLNEKPFSISPDPRYLYLSRRHADALAHLLYGISESGGFIQLTGEVGTGKTTLIRSLLEQLPDKTEIALILNPQLSTREFLQGICQELHLPFAPNDSAKALIDRLNTRLLAAHAEDRRVVLIVDEAQTMPPHLLEQVRLLTNLETAKKKLLQIILIGQPELRELLGRSEMRQIAQRITGRYHLEPLSEDDTAVYVEHRMKVAGGRPEVFSRRAIRKLYRLSRGIPRLINVIADRSLLGAYTKDSGHVGAGLVRQAANEVYGRPAVRPWWPWAAVAGVLTLVFVVAATLDDGLPTESALALLDSGSTSRPIPRDGAAGTIMRDASPGPRSSPLDASAAAVEGEPPVPETPPVSEPSEPSLAELIASNAVPSDETTATAALFALWDIPYTSVAGSVCGQASANGLACYWLQGSSISELRRLNRPVRLSLRDAAGVGHALTLSRLDGTHATIALAEGRTVRINIGDLTRYDYGEHLVLWRPAVGVTEQLRAGSRGPSVAWLRTSLEEVTGDSLASDEPDLYDAALVSAVRAYQRDRGLAVDGVVGNQTLLRLQTDIDLIGVRLVEAE